MNWCMTGNDWKEILFESEMQHLKEMMPVANKQLITSNEIFKALLEYEGIIGYDYFIKSMISRVYGLEIDKNEVAEI